jgi:ADP-ribosylation factor GTPase-activating protein 2/3
VLRRIGYKVRRTPLNTLCIPSESPSNDTTGFEGATSISSNAYFGRPEDDPAEEDYGDLETAAKDFVRKFGITAGDDLENLTSMLGEGATKLQGAVRNYLNS